MRRIRSGAWLPSQISAAPSCSRTVQFIGSMQAWASIGARYSARSTSALIVQSQGHARDSVAVCTDLEQALDGIVRGNESMNHLVSGVHDAVKQQSHGVQEINDAVDVIERLTRETAGSAQQTAAASQEFSAEAVRMQSMVETLTMILDGKRMSVS